MIIDIISGGRFHAYYLAQQLEKKKLLRGLYTFSATQEDQALLAGRIINHPVAALLDRIYFPLRLPYVMSSSRYNGVKDRFFGRWVAQKITYELPADIAVSWVNYGTESMPLLRQQGTIIVVESGSSHVLVQQQLLAAEYEKVGLTYTPLLQKNIARAVHEYAQADYIMTLSSSSRASFIAQGFSPERVLQVTPGVRVMSPTMIGSRAPKRYIVLFVGLVSVRKGVHHLLEAWEKLTFPEHTAELWIVGNMYHDMRELLKKMSLKKNIKFFNGVDQVTLHSFYQQASVLVLPSLEDGFGMVATEAMAYGVPVICSRQAGVADIISHDEDGLLFDAGNVEQLGRSILWGYQQRDMLRALGMKAYEKIQAYTWDAYGDRVVACYQKIIREKITIANSNMM